jgi:hypothetical protein
MMQDYNYKFPYFLRNETNCISHFILTNDDGPSNFDSRSYSKRCEQVQPYLEAIAENGSTNLNEYLGDRQSQVMGRS